MMRVPQLRARWRRFWHLAWAGPLRGECSVDLSDERGIKVIASGKPLRLSHSVPTYRRYRVYWKREEKTNEDDLVDLGSVSGRMPP